MLHERVVSVLCLRRRLLVEHLFNLQVDLAYNFPSFQDISKGKKLQ